MIRTPAQPRRGRSRHQPYGRPVRGPAVFALGGLLCALWLAGCDGRAEYGRQVEVCDLAQGNGILDAAVEACGAALGIAGQHDYPAPEVAALQHRLAQLERQRGNFEAATALIQAALEQARSAGDAAAEVERSVELALNLAGQERWLEGFGVLEAAAQDPAALDGEAAKAARSALRLYATRLEWQGHASEAERCRELAGVGKADG